MSELHAWLLLFAIVAVCLAAGFGITYGFAALVTFVRWLTRDRPAILIAAHNREERLRAGAKAALLVKINREITEHEAAVLRRPLHADLECLIYSGDHAKCGDCVTGWDPRGDRCGIITPCARYPECSLIKMPGRVQ